MLLTRVALGNKLVNLTLNSQKGTSNVVTVFMGDNGSGKSRLFQAVCSGFLISSQTKHSYIRSSDIDNLVEVSAINEINYNLGNIEYSIRAKNDSYIRHYNIGGEENSEVLTITISDASSNSPKIETFGYKDNPEVVDTICAHFLQEIKYQLSSFDFYKNGKPVNQLQFPCKILAVTGSPFDKFPYCERPELSLERSDLSYVYLGSRSKRLAGARYNDNSYLQGKFNQLGASFIKLFLKPKQEHLDFSKLFEFLDLSNKFTLHLRLAERVRKEEITEDKVLNVIQSVKFFKDKERDFLEFVEDKDMLSFQLVSAFKKILGEELDGISDRYNPFDNHTFNVDMDLNIPYKDMEYLNALVLLTDFDAIELDDISFSKGKSEHRFNLSQASSGELSVLFSLSSIAGEIQDDSLILIDEPELSLHPEWQVKFLPLLIDIFSNYKSCHFIISTHSPNLIASISEENSYVVDVSDENPKVIAGKDVRHKSIDYQMAEVFGVPQYGNEHLNKICINTLASIARNGSLTPEELMVAKDLLKFEELVPEGDYVRELIGLVRSALEALKEVNGDK